jgi:HSP20 family molecular chaperone IbpA
MATMETVGAGHLLPAHAKVREERGQYVVELDVSDFIESELSVEAVGPRLTVRGDQQPTRDDDGKPFRLCEHLEESFRLPDDANLDRTRVFYRHGTLEIQAPRMRLTPRPLPIKRPFYLVNPDAEAC